jgi:hypothetical protein
MEETTADAAYRFQESFLWAMTIPDYIVSVMASVCVLYGFVSLVMERGDTATQFFTYGIGGAFFHVLVRVIMEVVL